MASLFGEAFAARLMEVPVGRWEGPVESGYGIHLVRVRERTPGRPRSLTEARDGVEREWSEARRVRINDEFYNRRRSALHGPEWRCESREAGSPRSGS